MRFGFLINEVVTGLRRNVTMTVAMILTTAISIGLFGGGLLVVRGNASELLVLAGSGAGGRGADATDPAEAAADAARAVAARTGGAVAVSGAVDVVCDARRSRRVDRGAALLTRVTGTGCLLGALTAACTAVCEDPVEAALAATVWLDVAGEVAAGRAAGPGSFRMHLLDALDEVGREVER